MPCLLAFACFILPYTILRPPTQDRPSPLIPHLSTPRFVKDALSVPFKLSTSQIPQRQTNLRGEDPKLLSPSGGFGPVSDLGYGVSYMMADDARTFFHVSSKRSCATTDSARFMTQIKRALTDMRALFEEAAPVKSKAA
jgi:hypothetical protein